MPMSLFCRYGLSIALCGVILATHAAPKVLAQSQTQNGATIGGLAGAVIGGIVGHQNDESIEGVLIGGAVGAVAGGVLGHTRDHQQGRYNQAPVYRSQGYQAPVYQQSSGPYYPAVSTTTTTTVKSNASRAVTFADVITMTRSGVNDAVILNQIGSNGIAAKPEVNDVVVMHQQGVSDVVIAAMQQSRQLDTYTTVTTPAPVVVHEAPVVVTRPVYYEQPVYYRAYHDHGHYRRGF